MIKLLSTLSILIYTTYSQSCTNTHDTSTIISISTNKFFVVDQIGTDTFNGIVADALNQFLPTDGNYIGINAFGGVNGGDSTYEIVDYTTTERDYSDISSDVINLGSNSAIDYTKNYGNVVSDAMGLALNDLTDTSRQRYHVIFSSGLPLANGFGDATDPDNLNNPCTAAISAKQAGIQTYVVLIGDEEQNAFPGYYSCIVEDPDNDIFIIDPQSPDYTDLKAALCKNEPNGYDIQITEVNPQASNTFDAFVEVYNRGAPAPIRACLGDSGDSGNTGCAPASNVDTGEYLVASNNAAEPGDVQTNLGTSTASATTEWLARARVSGTDYDSVDYDSTDVYPDGILDDRSFELRAIGFNNQYPTNWRLACYNVFGTPGDAPVEQCAAYTNSDSTGGSCGLSEGAGFCNDITGANCNTADGDVCECPDAKLSDYDTCINMPVPTTCTGKLAKFNGVDYLFFQWDRVKFDGAVNYDISYLKQGGQGDKSSGVAAVGVSDYRTSLVSGGTFTTTFTAKYTSPIEDKAYSDDSGALNCGTTTLDPTKAPTTEPTASPIEVPTSSPTRQPTQDDPGVFMKGTGGLARENCFEEGRSCCTPFGPQFTDNADTAGGAIVPSDGCDVYRTDIVELQESKTEDIEHTIILQKYGEAIGATTTVGVYMYSYGLINMTDFARLNFTGNYVNDGIIGDLEVGVGFITTTTRRRELLQGATPSPTYEYGNKLNIEVNPPGVSQDWSGDVVIAASDETDSLKINITTATLKCDDGEIGCTTYDECTSQGLAYAIVVTDCDSDDFLDECAPMYPQVQFLAIRRSTALCGIIFGVGNEEDELPGWFWWVLIALIIFLLILAWLVYRFWWKQKKTAAELGDAEDELDQQVADNEAGFGKELDVGDVAFNPMATGVPGMNRPADAFGNELHQRQMEQQNDMVDVQAEIFQVRQDYGQVATGPRHHNQGGY